MRRLIVSLALAVGMCVPCVANAAAPDGPGPWADFVASSQQGLRVDGTPVLPDRSNPLDAVGVAEDNPSAGGFFSLGFGGEVVLGYENNICNGPGADVDLELVEGTFEPYPPELVDVYVSADGVNFTLAASGVDKDATVGMPDSVPIARYVKLVDVSDPGAFGSNPSPADGYDVDGVRALRTNCTAEGRMTGGGSVFAGSLRVTHGFTLRCDGGDNPQRLEVNWGKGNKFHLTSLTGVLCSDDPALIPNQPKAGFDTYEGTGVGKYNGAAGATASWKFTDAGEPGTSDTAQITIWDANGNQVLTVSGPLEKGNHQAH